MHFANLYVFNRLRRRAVFADNPPPVAPDACLPPANQGQNPWRPPVAQQ